MDPREAIAIGLQAKRTSLTPLDQAQLDPSHKEEPSLQALEGEGSVIQKAHLPALVVLWVVVEAEARIDPQVGPRQPVLRLEEHIVA
jgi:hypothetical protein